MRRTVVILVALVAGGSAVAAASASPDDNGKRPEQTGEAPATAPERRPKALAPPKGALSAEREAGDEEDDPAADDDLLDGGGGEDEDGGEGESDGGDEGEDDGGDEGEDDGRIGFGARTLVALRLGTRRIPAKGPLTVEVSNANGFAVSGKLSATTKRIAITSRRKRRIKLIARAFTVGPNARRAVKLKLPSGLRPLLRRNGKLILTARVTDPAGNTRTVKKEQSPKFKKTRRR